MLVRVYSAYIYCKFYAYFKNIAQTHITHVGTQEREKEIYTHTLIHYLLLLLL
jgi:hypothetical protein